MITVFIYIFINLFIYLFIYLFIIYFFHNMWTNRKLTCWVLYFSAYYVVFCTCHFYLVPQAPSAIWLNQNYGIYNILPAPSKIWKLKVTLLVYESWEWPFLFLFFCFVFNQSNILWNNKLPVSWMKFQCFILLDAR